MEKNMRNRKLPISDVAESMKHVDDEIATEQKIKEAAYKFSNEGGKVQITTTNVVVATPEIVAYHRESQRPPEPPEPPDQGMSTTEELIGPDLRVMIMCLAVRVRNREKETKMGGTVPSSHLPPLQLPSPPSFLPEPLDATIAAVIRDKERGTLSTVESRSHENTQKEGRAKLELQDLSYLIDLMGPG